MSVQPNSVIHLLKFIPFDNEYRHTYYFETPQEQENYFIKQHPKSFNNQQFTRVSTNKCRLQIPWADAMNYNYMMFQNTSYSKKWFYAFITQVEYYSETATEISFELDIMQTFMFNYTLKPCFVEREHSETDVAGDNIVAEPVDLGDIIQIETDTYLFEKYYAVIATAYDPDGTPGGVRGGLFSGLKYEIADIDTVEDCEVLLENLKLTTDNNKQDSIVSIFYLPFQCKVNENTLKPNIWTKDLKKPTHIGGYRPKNKKLLTYPFTYLAVDCGSNDATYRYEYFAGDDFGFNIIGTLSCNPQIACVPRGYNSDQQGGNWCEKLVLSGFPQIAYSIDAYRAWLAQEASTANINIASSFASLVSSGVGMGFMGASGGASVGAVSGGLNGVINSATNLAHSLNSVALAKNRPPQAKGQQSGDVDVATRNKGFYFKQMGVTEEYARMIDDFFTKYGYSCGKIKIPNISSRPLWNYVKTMDCEFFGSIPVNYAKKIKEIYNSGITFWKTTAIFGDYTQDNSPQ